jgi:CBS domain containing-hemolysin-like protein
VAASYKIDDLNDELSLSLESDDNDSVGGYIIEKLDRFPVRGDRLDTEKVEFVVEKAEPNRVVSIILKLKETQAV